MDWHFQFSHSVIVGFGVEEGFNRVDRVEHVEGDESGFNAEAQSRRDAQSDLGLEGSEPPKHSEPTTQNPQIRAEKSLRSSAPLRLCVKNNSVYSVSSAVENISATAQSIFDASSSSCMQTMVNADK